MCKHLQCDRSLILEFLQLNTIEFKASLDSLLANLLARSESWQGHCYYVHKCIRSTSSKNRAGDRVRDKKKKVADGCFPADQTGCQKQATFLSQLE